MSDRAAAHAYGIMIIVVMGFFIYMMVGSATKKETPPVAIATTMEVQASNTPVTIQSAIRDSGAAEVLRKMSAQTPEGAALRDSERNDVINKLNSNLMIMTLTCINGTLYIVHDASDVNIGLSPLYENGADHPTACRGGTHLTPDTSQRVAMATLKR